MVAKEIDSYKPYRGFYDLREFKLPKKTFVRLWKIQDILSDMTENSEYYRKWHPFQWEAAQELSAKYQSILFGKRKMKGGMNEERYP